MRRRHLHEIVPGLDRFTCPLPLGTLPTPVSEAPALAAALGVRELWVKRDDLSSPHYGGSKVRSLEYLLGAALAEGASGVVTLGSTGSHHVLATALFASRAGLRSRAVLFPQPDSDDVATTARCLAALGTDVRAVRHVLGVPLAWWRARREPLGSTRPYVIPPGGTSPVGLLGAVEGALELAAALRDGSLPRPELVVVPAGSCGTAAGLRLGLALASVDVPILAVRVAPRAVARASRVRALAAAGLRLLRLAGFRGAPSFGPLRWDHSQVGGGYAVATDGARRAVVAAAEAGLFRAETTYTGKALAAVSAAAPRASRILFWNTYSAVDPRLA